MQLDTLYEDSPKETGDFITKIHSDPLPNKVIDQSKRLSPSF